MKIEKTQQADRLTLMLEGRLDTVTQSELAAELEQIFSKGPVHLVLDMAKLQYVSSAGLRVLLSAQKRVNALGTSMKLCGLTPEVREVFELTGFSSIMDIE